MANEGVPPETTVLNESAWFASRVLLDGETETASAGFTVTSLFMLFVVSAVEALSVTKTQ